MPRHLIIRLEAPLLAFGGVVIDNYGFTRDFPARSMLTGLVANALGWRRSERKQHQDLQSRLIFAARIERESHIGHLQDVQNAHLLKSDKGWTTRGQSEGRAGNSYGGPHRRFRDYHPDALALIALRLDPPEQQPDLDLLAHAFDFPARPLFIGRKPCLPSAPLLMADGPRFIEAPTAGEALALVPWQEAGHILLRAIWPQGEAPAVGHDEVWQRAICDERNWHSGLHGGVRTIVEGRLSPPAAKATATDGRKPQ